MNSSWRSVVFLMPVLLISACSKADVPSFDPDHAWDYLVRQCEFGPRTPGTDAHDEKKDSLKTTPIPGANDGASGVAVLLELARIMGQHHPGKLGVDMVFFDGEDYGKVNDLENYLLGSKYFAADLSRQPQGYHPVCGILLDMVGGKNAKIYKELNSLQIAPEVTNELFERARRLKLDMFVNAKGTAIYDDHVPLLRAGIKTVDLIDTNYEYWHTLSDTPEHCSKDSLAQTGVLLLDFLYNFPF
jgi:glutaminyl-peptide cyclotransferase